MATAIVKLYLIPEFEEEKNFVVDNISSFLAARSSNLKKEISDFQFQKIELVKRIKIDASQVYAERNFRPWNYCAITNYYSVSQQESQFYFVKSYRPAAKNTIELELQLDVLNSFFPFFKDKFTDQTYLIRAHKDRFKLINASQTALSLAEIVDRVSEGDSPELYASSDSEETIADGSGEEEASKHFYLVYRTSEDGRPCIDMAAKSELLLELGSSGSGDFVMDLSDLVQNRYYYLVGNFSAVFKNTEYVQSVPVEDLITKASANGFLRFKKVSSSELQFMFYDSFTAETGTIEPYGTTAIVRITLGDFLYYSDAATADPETARGYDAEEINAGDTQNRYLRSITLLDRTNSSIVKVIETPYCPISYTKDSGTGEYTFADFFETESPEGFFRTYDLTKSFPPRSIASFKINLSNSVLIEKLTTPTAWILSDPKLENSAYSRHTFFYDSFAYAVSAENYEYENSGSYIGIDLDLKYKQSANVSSALLFDFQTNGLTSHYYMERGQDNFPTILVASRNNELTLFSSEYLNYLRNGYNYDKKKAAESTAFQAGITALQMAASVLAFAASIPSGGATLPAGIGLAAGAAVSGANLAYSSKNASDSIDQKINTLKKQSYSVAGVDDLDLFKYYGENKLKYKLYKVSDRLRDSLNEKFRLYGYAIEDYADPYSGGFMFSRHWFNYLQCEAVFNVQSKDIPGEYIEEITDRLKAGITIFHPAAYSYDLDTLRGCENFEESILNLL